DPATQDGAPRGFSFRFPHQGFRNWNHAGIALLLACHHDTSRERPSSSPILARKPRSRSALPVSASRLETAFTFRSGPYSGFKSEFITLSSAAASSLRL